MTDYVRQYETPRFPFERQEAERLIANFDKGASLVEGVVRWNSNGRVPPRDVLDLWKHVGKPFDHDRSVKAGEKETIEFLAAYRMANRDRKPDPEELAEMRVAFGPGAEVVDVITGRRTVLASIDDESAPIAERQRAQ